ncbi:hypothetical protein GLYMA_05G135050v4 [Glycine max]|nr:hypothetical protein GLYMA_05G135050v4 [Glycine max]KAH1134206.1 hypothetical protein GYH30_012559 [Glycine max]
MILLLLFFSNSLISLSISACRSILQHSKILLIPHF